MTNGNTSTPGRSLICVDDSPVTLNLYDGLFRTRGHELRLCRDPDEARQAFAASPSDLVIVGVDLPTDAGYELCEYFRKQPESYDVPILIVSSRRTEAAIARGFSAGADDYVVKPFESAELQARVARLLERRGQPAAQLGLAPNALFAGRYQIERRIGQGGHSAVYAVHDVILDPQCERLVVLKLFDLVFYRTRDERYLSLFLREAYEHSKLNHPNVISFLDFGQAHGQYFLVMEYLRGLNLDEMLREQGPLREDNLLFFGHEVAKALVYLEGRGIVHRDIKPTNIMVTDDARVKILDFGLARRSGDSTLSFNDEFLGTPHFVWPEYICGHPAADARADIYSLGVTLYYAATGRFPFVGDSPIDILEKHIKTRPTPVGQVRTDLSRKFAELVDSMMARDRDDRPTPAQALRAFRHMLGRTPAAAVPLRGGGSPGVTPLCYEPVPG